MKLKKNQSKKVSFVIAFGLHLLIVLLIIFSVEKTLVLPPEPSEVQKPIIDAVMINKKSLQEEIARLEAKETKKREQEENRIKELAQKEKEAKQKAAHEEALALELKKKNEALEKAVQEKKIAQEKQEKERLAKLKQEQEELKKIQKEKEEALALKKKMEEEKLLQEKLQKEKALAEQKAQEEAQAKAPQISPRVKQDLITRHAMLIRSKIHQFWRKPIGFDFEGYTCVVEVRLLPTGEVVQAAVVESSGSLEFDRSAELAVKKASPLPMPEDVNVAKEFRQFTFLFREVV
ncbi:MAG: cell envelope integrity protein TolA [Proteobacteria bacterium]|nr:cell envelope integrity protein TolA [Pseudomonadota bacterium]